MRNPFDDLSKQSRLNRRHIAIRQHEQQRKTLLDEERIEARRQIKQRYDVMVKGLLDQLIQSINPDLKQNVSEWGWSMGRWRRVPEDNSLRWQSFIDIQLIYEMNDTPLYFEVTRHRKKARAGLGEDELALVLRTLYTG